MKFRRLQASIPKRTNAYTSSVRKQWDIHNIGEKIVFILEHKKEFTKNNLEHQLNAVDKQIGEILTHAEKNVRI